MFNLSLGFFCLILLNECEQSMCAIKVLVTLSYVKDVAFAPISHKQTNIECCISKENTCIILRLIIDHANMSYKTLTINYKAINEAHL